MSKKEKRYIATIEIYVYAEDDKQALIASRQITRKLNDNYDCRAKVSELHESPFGKLVTKEINVQD